MPLVSVVLPAYNAGEYILDSISSILSQTLPDFELIVVDDGSTDDTDAKTLSLKDARVRYERNQRNLGLAATLNVGLWLARGRYIARMDADDIAAPRRLELQCSFLERHGDYVACGTWARPLGGIGDAIRHEHNSNRLRARLLFDTQLAHPTVMLRTEVLRKSGLRYDESYRVAEDYDLWIRLVNCGKFTNLRRSLLDYRYHKQSLSAQNTDLLETTLGRLRRKALRLVNIEPTEQEMKAHRCLAEGELVDTDVTRRELETWCRKLLAANEATGYTTNAAMASVLRERMWKMESRRGGLRYTRHLALRAAQVYLTGR